MDPLSNNLLFLIVIIVAIISAAILPSKPLVLNRFLLNNCSTAIHLIQLQVWIGTRIMLVFSSSVVTTNV